MNTALTLIAFVIGLAVVVYFVTRSQFFAPLIPFSANAMRARRQSLDEALANADRAEKRLAEVRTEIDAEVAKAQAQADEIVDRARREAVAMSEETAARARREAAAFLERASNDVGVERERAISELRRELSRLVVEGAGAVLSEALDERTHQRLIEDSLSSLHPRAEERN
jgi:F-type H+-transporting ATPase subunit b